MHKSGWLEEAGAPLEIREQMAARARRGAMDALQMIAFVREALDAFAEERLDALVLKGPAIELDAFSGLGARGHGDLDLLVAPEAIPRAVQVLQDLGLAWEGWLEPADPDRPPLGPDALERPLARPLLRDVTLSRGPVRVELHWRFFSNPRLMPVDPRWLRFPHYVEGQGLRIPTLPHAVNWLYVLVHGSNHLWSRMKWLADVPAIARRHPDRVRRDALEQQAGAGSDRAIAAGLVLAETVFGPFLLPESRAWAHAVPGAPRLVRMSLEALGAEHDPPKRVSPRDLPRYVSGRLAVSGDPMYRLEEARLLLLSAGRAQAIEHPGLATLATGPWSWARRSVRRLIRS